eukprot:m.259188 g.259188  ORF g.259188 m.259188 type:complete len:499 (-) comp37676_c0_seq1:100-1596(-)
MDYRPIAQRRFPRLAERETAENRFWKKLEFPVVVKEFSAISQIDFCPTKPHDFAVCSSIRVQLYSSITNKLKRSISRFKEVVHCASYRHDGQLLVTGCETKEVQVFDMNSRAILRTFAGHGRGVHSTQFSTDGVNIMSCSDDNLVKLWDLTIGGDALRTFEGHTDYVRCGATCATASNLFLSGSYDHTAKLWDTRTGAEVLSVDHGAPVEAVLMFPGGSSFITAGSNYIKVWDAIGKTRALHTFSNHQKTITCLKFDSDHKRLLSGSLDRQLKVYDVKDYTVVHSAKYSAPILSMALSASGSHLAVGTTTGMLNIKHRALVKNTKNKEKKSAPRVGTYKYFVRGQNHSATTLDYKVVAEKRKRLKAYDRLMKKFEYYEALDSILETYHRPVTTISFLQELIYRGALKQALSGRDEVTLKPLLTFVAQNIVNPRFASLLLDVADVIIDLYGAVIGQSAVVDEYFVKLHRKLQAEAKFQQQLFELMGSMDLLLSSRDAQG